MPETQCSASTLDAETHSNLQHTLFKMSGMSANHSCCSAAMHVMRLWGAYTSILVNRSRPALSSMGTNSARLRGRHLSVDEKQRANLCEYKGSSH